MSDKYLVTTQLIPQRAAEKVLPALREALDFGVQFVLLSPGDSNPPPGIVSEPWGVAVGVIKIMGHPDDQIEEALAPLKALDMHLSFEWVMIR